MILKYFLLAPSPSGGSQLQPTNTSTLRDSTNIRKMPSASDLTGPTGSTSRNILPSPPPLFIKEDIRLCTINRADANDAFGIELNYHRKEQFHSLSIIPGRNNGPSSKLLNRTQVINFHSLLIDAELAGIKSEDRLIEINGQNIQTLDHEHVTQRIRSVEYPEPLQMLVVDVPTYEYYKQQQKLIHRSLPNVKILPPNAPARSISPAPSSRPCMSKTSSLSKSSSNESIS